jgi:hypothetical protein
VNLVTLLGYFHLPYFEQSKALIFEFESQVYATIHRSNPSFIRNKNPNKLYKKTRRKKLHLHQHPELEINQH